MMYKKSNVVTDYLGGLGGDTLLHYGTHYLPISNKWKSTINQLPGSVGYIHGIATDTPTLDEFKELDKHQAKSLIPGVGNSRLMRRRKLLRRLLKKNKKSGDFPFTEGFGHLLNIPISGLTGALAGAGIGKALGRDPYMSAGAGAFLYGSSTLLGTLGGPLAAALTSRRTLEEQERYENSPTRVLKSLFIPGYSSYNYFKSLGAAKHLSEMTKEEIEKEVERIRKLRGYV